MQATFFYPGKSGIIAGASASTSQQYRVITYTPVIILRLGVPIFCMGTPLPTQASAFPAYSLTMIVRDEGK